MDTGLGAPARVARPGEPIGPDELRLATRNHGMPLEALRYDVTPPGLHYVLVHYDIPYVEPGGWRLTVDGAVRRPVALTAAELRARPRRTLRVTLECAGNGRARLEPRPVSQPWLDEAVGTADWTGTPLAALLRDVGLPDGAHTVVFTGADHGTERGVEQDYQRALPLVEAMRPEVLLADTMNGAPLPPQHGFPLRLVVPGWYGMAHVKWLREITVLTGEFDGFQNAVAYRLKDRAEDAGEPVTRIRPRALLAPPGYPDFMSRIRVVAPGSHLLSGRAWSGTGPVVRVLFSAGGDWTDAELGPVAGHWAWREFRVPWWAEPGSYQLSVRAIDATGRAQPVEPPWNVQGMANNMAQRVPVVVPPGGGHGAP
ncbi:sulfite oxidase [Actinocatenispora rupis]|uniref:sulfite oxidase n=1 Tax=Actinocatenispora rupis TaxID=519421 RepID=UPI001EF1CBB7|nr:sulfite oxidase [Actinocatenispora rupis]